MAFVVPVTGELELLNRILGLSTNGDLSLRLFINNLNPVEGTVKADISECISAGYAPITLTSTSWTVAVTGGQSTATYPEQTFTLTSSAKVFGYFILDDAGNLVLLERFTSAPFDLPSAGGQIAITPTISLE